MVQFKKALLDDGDVKYMTFDEAHDKFFGYACSAALKVYSKLDDDALQATRISLWRSYCNYDLQKNMAFKIYAYCNARWTIMSLLRAERRRPQPISLDAQLYDESSKTLYDYCETHLPDIEIALSVRDALLQLKDNDRICLIESLNGYTQVELGSKFHVKQSTVSRCIRRAKLQFMRIYRGGELH